MNEKSGVEEIKNEGNITELSTLASQNVIQNSTDVDKELKNIVRAGKFSRLHGWLLVLMAPLLVVLQLERVALLLLFAAMTAYGAYFINSGRIIQTASKKGVRSYLTANIVLCIPTIAGLFSIINVIYSLIAFNSYKKLESMVYEFRPAEAVTEKSKKRWIEIVLLGLSIAATSLLVLSLGNQSSLNKPDTYRSFSYADLGFSVNMPVEPKRTTTTATDDALSITRFTSASDYVGYEILVIDISSLQSSSTNEEIIEGSNLFGDSTQFASVEEVFTTQSNVLTYTSRYEYYKVRVPGAYLADDAYSQTFIIDNKLYVIATRGATQEEFFKFQASFQEL
jgi:hypothetical protein